MSAAVRSDSESMTQTSQFNQILEMIDRLSLEEKEELINIVPLS